MNINEPDLDTFEQALLLQLRTHVQQAATDNTPGTAATPRRSRRAWYAVAAAAAAAILALALLLHVVRPEPAFAVTGRNGSKITVKVARLEGADRLEQALHDRGVNADITYLPRARAAPRTATPNVGPGPRPRGRGQPLRRHHPTRVRREGRHLRSLGLGHRLPERHADQRELRHRHRTRLPCKAIDTP